MKLHALFARAFAARKPVARPISARNARRIGAVAKTLEPDVNMFGESPSAMS